MENAERQAARAVLSADPIWTTLQVKSISHRWCISFGPVDRWTWKWASSEPFFRKRNEIHLETSDYRRYRYTVQRCEVRVETRDWKPTQHAYLNLSDGGTSHLDGSFVSCPENFNPESQCVPDVRAAACSCRLHMESGDNI